MAGPFLKAATQSQADVLELINQTAQLIKTVMFGVGVKDLLELKNPSLLVEIN